MAPDLASTPTVGIRVQCCGDAHLCNFGGFATPERRVIFAINDLDDSLAAPWEWDAKRLAGSFVVACRDNGLSDATARDVVMTCVRSYRQSMGEFSRMETLELWYFALESKELLAGIKDPDFGRRANQRLQKERARSIAEDVFPKLAEHKAEMPVIKDQLPTIFHAEGYRPGEILRGISVLLLCVSAPLTLPRSADAIAAGPRIRSITAAIRAASTLSCPDRARRAVSRFR